MTADEPVGQAAEVTAAAERKINRLEYALLSAIAERDDARAAVARAWDDGYNDAATMARCYGHTDHWEDEPDNPYRAALRERP